MMSTSSASNTVVPLARLVNVLTQLKNVGVFWGYIRRNADASQKKDELGQIPGGIRWDHSL